MVDDIKYTYVNVEPGICFNDDMFRNILSYCVEDTSDIFKLDTTVRGWFNKVMIKNVKIKYYSHYYLLITDYDITYSNRFNKLHSCIMNMPMSYEDNYPGPYFFNRRMKDGTIKK